MSERLRKRAFDSGTFSLLTYIDATLKDVEAQPFKSIRDHIKQQVLNYANMQDLTYHCKLLKFLQNKPAHKEDPAQMRLNQSSALEESKDVQDDKSPVRMTEPAVDGDDDVNQSSFVLNSPDGQPLLSPTMSERVSVAKQNGTSMANWQMSPRGNKTRMMKKTSSMNNYHVHNGAAINGSARDGYQTENQKPLY